VDGKAFEVGWDNIGTDVLRPTDGRISPCDDSRLVASGKLGLSDNLTPAVSREARKSSDVV